MNQQQTLRILSLRKSVEVVNTTELIEKRKKFMNWLLVKNPDLRVLEMYDDELKSKERIPQYFNEWKYCNTRTKIATETRVEIDRLPFDETMKIMCEIIKILMPNYHFAIFYSEGQRSLHIIVYDFEELANLSPFQREKAQAQFWRKVVPFFFHYLDQGIWSDNHYLPMEFAPHWRTGQPFNLILEWMPQEKKE